LSFFDDVEEPSAEQSTRVRPRRPSSGGRRPPVGGRGGGPRRPPTNQAIRARQGVALAALIVVVILIVVGVHSCQVSQANNDLRNYAVSVSSLMTSSNQTGDQFFRNLAASQGSGASANLQSSVDESRLSADHELGRAKGLSAPGQLQSAQQDLVRTLQLRADGISAIAGNLPSALQAQTSSSSVTSIAADMARFYASDVLYKDYTLPMIVKALRNASIPVGGPGGEPIQSGQFLPNLQWLLPSFVATELRAPTTPTSSGGKVAPGTHGSELTSVSVGGTTLQTGSTNTIPAQPPPTFTLSFINSGQNKETNVGCKVSVSGAGISGIASVTETSPGQTYTCKITLSSSPPPGAYTVTATVLPVPGEKNTSNNKLTLPVTFQ
jgi:hypothetical protein